MRSKSSITLFRYTSQLAERLRSLGRERTAETYTAAVKSIMSYMNGADIKLQKIDSLLISSYEAFLLRRGLKSNTTSFYIRNLRAIYNRAVEENLITDVRPFRRVYTGVCKTLKRALDSQTIRSIAQFKTSDTSLQMAADLFMFSFFAHGMAFTDIAYLKWSNIQNGYLVYNRRKTSTQIVVRWEKCMAEIAEKYRTVSSQYIFPIIKGTNPRREYLTAAHSTNKKLKRIGEILEITIPLTFYVARHSWASIAYTKQVPISVISRAMGHNSESTTRIYLASLDNSEVDNAGRLVLRSISF